MWGSLSKFPVPKFHLQRWGSSALGRSRIFIFKHPISVHTNHFEKNCYKWKPLLQSPSLGFSQPSFPCEWSPYEAFPSPPQPHCSFSACPPWFFTSYFPLVELSRCVFFLICLTLLLQHGSFTWPAQVCPSFVFVETSPVPVLVAGDPWALGEQVDRHVGVRGFFALTQ